MTTEFWHGLLVGFLLATVATSAVWLLLSEWWEARRVVPVVHTDEWDEDDDFDSEYTPEDQEALLRWSQ